MKPRNSLRFSLALLGSALLVTLFIANYQKPITSAAASPEIRLRHVQRLPSERNEPISLRRVKLKNNDTKLKNKEPFLADEGWLNGLKVEVKNKTQKPITFLSIQLQFPRSAGDYAPISIDYLEAGDRTLLSQKLETASPILRPGLQMELGLSSLQHSLVRRLLAQTGYPSHIDDIRMRVSKIIFADDTMWYAGSYFRRDPTTPGSWINAEAFAAAAKKNRFQRIPSAAAAREFESERQPTVTPVDSFVHNQPSSVSQLFVKTSYSVNFQGCKALFANSVHECGVPYTSCNYPYDLLDTAAGSYYLAAASARCMNGNQGCNNWQSTNIANLCGGGGGGGGGGEGGGGGYDGNGSCYTNWDCDFGYHCGDAFMCQEDEFLN